MITALIAVVGLYVTLELAARRVHRSTHEPRAVKLLGPAKPPCFDRRDVGAHECMYIEVQRLGEVEKSWRCVSCGESSPMPVPGDGMRAMR